MVNLSKIDTSTYKALGFKSKTIGQTIIKEVFQTKVKQFKTVAALVAHLQPKISDMIKLGFDVNDKKLSKQLRKIKSLSKSIDKLDKPSDTRKRILKQTEYTR